MIGPTCLPFIVHCGKWYAYPYLLASGKWYAYPYLP